MRTVRVIWDPAVRKIRVHRQQQMQVLKKNRTSAAYSLQMQILSRESPRTRSKYAKTVEGGGRLSAISPLRACSTAPTADSAVLTLNQLVFSQYGHGYRVNPTAQSAVQRKLALLDFGHPLLPKCGALYTLLFHLRRTLRVIPSYLECYDSTPSAVTVPRNSPYGLCHYCKYGCVCLCSGLGP